jgi:KDO2-lipid IV(A) lauroyltransferase
MRKKLEFWLVLAVARILGRLPRGLARWFSGVLAWNVYRLHGRLRRVGERNLELAFPKLSCKAHDLILRGVFRHLGWQLVEFCRMTRYTAENTRGWMRTEGLDHYLAAQARGKGVLIVTGHLGAWELSSFYHSLMGHPMGMVIRRLDNRWLDEYVNGIRCLHGNRVLSKDDFGRGLLTAMRQGETVGILMDTNMTPPQGEFVEFFGQQACTGTGLLPQHEPGQHCRAGLEGSAARVHAVGEGRTSLRAPLRSGAGFRAYRGRAGRHRRRHATMHQRHRSLDSALS